MGQMNSDCGDFGTGAAAAWATKGSSMASRKSLVSHLIEHLGQKSHRQGNSGEWLTLTSAQESQKVWKHLHCAQSACHFSQKSHFSIFFFCAGANTCFYIKIQKLTREMV
jgi:hypothetical protein